MIKNQKEIMNMIRKTSSIENLSVNSKQNKIQTMNLLESTKTDPYIEKIRVAKDMNTILSGIVETKFL